MVSRIKTWLLFTLLAHRLGIVEHRYTDLAELDISDYTFTVMENNNLRTVQDALFAYCLRHPTPGIGEGSWDDFLNNVS